MTISNTFIRNISLALAAVLFVALALAVAPKAQAADMGIPGGDFGWVTDSIDQFYTPDSFGGGDYGWVTDSIDQYYSPASEFGGMSDFGGSSFGGMSGLSGFSGLGSMLGGGSAGNRQSQSQSQAQSQSQTSTNINTNNNTINVSTPVTTTITVPTQATPVCPQGTTGTYPNCVWPQPNCPTNTSGTWPNCVYAQPQPYDICPNIAGIQSVLPAGYYLQNGYCYQNAQPIYPTYTQPTPYVTLAAVPYTGLELGPVGTALYWGFLVAWCLLAAYLIAVKKVQNKVAAWFFGGNTDTSAPVATVTHAPQHKSAPVMQRTSGIDPFIASQIHRA